MRSPEWLGLDRTAAARATILATAVLVVLLLVQGAVTAAVTSGTQSMAAVEDVPTQPGSSAWDGAPSRTVTLSKQQMAVPFGGGSTDNVTVEALTNETHVAFRLSWHDPTNDTSIGAPLSYSDATAILFHSGTVPPITMGGVGTPVNIWYWRASWEFGAKNGPWSGDMYTYPHPDNETRPGLAADNPLSKNQYRQFAQNYYAKGFGSLSHAPVQPVHAVGHRTDDGWAVTFVRRRVTDGTYDASFNTSKPMYMAFAVWNGSADEVNGQKSITLQFTRLDLTNVSMMAANAGGNGGGPSSPSGEAGGSASSLPSSLGPWLAVLLGATLFTWLIAYRRVRT